MRTKEGHELFARIRDRWVARPGVTTGTMMGFPCLRVEGAFFACVHREGTHLLVKLPSERVTAAIAGGGGEPFAPSGRVFREWLAVGVGDAARWEDLVGEAYAFVTRSP